MGYSAVRAARQSKCLIPYEAACEPQNSYLIIEWLVTNFNSPPFVSTLCFTFVVWLDSRGKFWLVVWAAFTHGGLGVEDYFCAFVRLCLVRVGRLYVSASVRLQWERQLQSQCPRPPRCGRASVSRDRLWRLLGVQASSQD